MLVSVTFSRRFGRKLPAESRPDVTGNLIVAARRGSMVAEIRGPGPATADPLARLWDVRLLEIDRVIRLRGYEQSDAAGMLQEWECRIIRDGQGAGIPFHVDDYA